MLCSLRDGLRLDFHEGRLRVRQASRLLADGRIVYYRPKFVLRYKRILQRTATSVRALVHATAWFLILNVLDATLTEYIQRLGNHISPCLLFPYSSHYTAFRSLAFG